mgnify:CR=1 FL=1
MMIELSTFGIYLIKFFQVVVMNCIRPTNWDACSKPEEWLIPELIYGWKLKTGEIVPYQTEKDYLNKREE